MPKAAASVVVPSAALRLRPESLRSFVDMYEEKMKTMVEMDALEVSVQKSRIPRRRYKVRRRMLETRLSTLSRSLEEARERMRGAGSHYVDLMRQLEIAETDIKEAETNVRSIETRHNRGELSLEAYRKLLADYERRKENAETAINGILIRLREEIR
jgi:chromosome segregation ATPase